MIDLQPVELDGYGVRLEPLRSAHAGALEAAAADGRLWEIGVTGVPAPGDGPEYVAAALDGQRAGTMLPWIVRLAAPAGPFVADEIVGSTRYHDVLPEVDRVEIGYTWYSRSVQRTHVNTACKLLLLEHAFDRLGCGVVGWRTDGENLASRRAIEALGAELDGVLRRHRVRRTGAVADTAMYSMLAADWPAARRRLEARLARHGGPARAG